MKRVSQLRGMAIYKNCGGDPTGTGVANTLPCIACLPSLWRQCFQYR